MNCVIDFNEIYKLNSFRDYKLIGNIANHEGIFRSIKKIHDKLWVINYLTLEDYEKNDHYIRSLSIFYDSLPVFFINSNNRTIVISYKNTLLS